MWSPLFIHLVIVAVVVVVVVVVDLVPVVAIDVVVGGAAAAAAVVLVVVIVVGVLVVVVVVDHPTAHENTAPLCLPTIHKLKAPGSNRYSFIGVLLRNQMAYQLCGNFRN